MYDLFNKKTEIVMTSVFDIIVWFVLTYFARVTPATGTVALTV